MAYKITEDCKACGNCKEACPVDAIVEKDGKYIINADECVDCGTCESNCPVNAAVPA
ncbi:MAG: 4Fe-4S binding protein [Oscillospiraceae bacterium]|jgi:MinD superfamily P-loop ATPase|nr:4Fe-4S binding protein [Oscillospiraceae bacterium]